jgi:Fe-S-cluster containining protein
MKASILDHEVKDFPEAVYDDVAKRHVLPKAADGTCIHLVDGKCSIYAKRPYSCRIFDCRMYAMAGVNIANSPLLLEAIASWTIKFKTPEDREVLLAMRATTARMIKAGVKSQTEIVRAALKSGADHAKGR